jgi:hypothetical protein
MIACREGLELPDLCKAIARSRNPLFWRGGTVEALRDTSLPAYRWLLNKKARFIC